MAPKGDLRLLNDRLNRIATPGSTAGFGPQSPEIKSEEDVIDSTANKFICAECGESYHKISFLVHHYTRLHTQAGFVCPVPDCGVPYQNQPRLMKHYDRKHGRPAHCPFPGCTRQYATWGKFSQHLDTHTAEAHSRGYYTCFDSYCRERFPDLTRLTQHVYQAHPGVSQASGCLECRKRFPTDQDLYLHYQTAHPFSGTLTLNCPAIDCSYSFPNTDELYDHYRNSGHPPYIPNQEPRHLAFKCPFGFCARAYSSEIGLGIHSALAHGSEIGGVQVDPIASGRGFDNAESFGNQTFASNHQADNPIEHIPRDIEENVVEIDEEGAVLYQQLKNYLMNENQPDQRADSSYSSDKLTIGFILNNHSNSNDSGGDTQWRDSMRYFDDGQADFPTEDLARGILHGTLQLLQADDQISVYELLEIWHVFLNAGQRRYVIQQLKNFNLREDSETLVARLRGSVLGAVISGWVRFKTLLDQTPPQLQNAVGRRPRFSARDTAWAILMHCMLLEALRDKGVASWRENGFNQIPDRLRIPSQGYYLYEPTATFAQILDALAERAQCRKTVPEGVQLTNAMVLTELPKYVAELKEEVVHLYPDGPQDSANWLQVFGPG